MSSSYLSPSSPSHASSLFVIPGRTSCSLAHPRRKIIPRVCDDVDSDLLPSLEAYDGAARKDWRAVCFFFKSLFAFRCPCSWSFEEQLVGGQNELFRKTRETRSYCVSYKSLFFKKGFPALQMDQRLNKLAVYILSLCMYSTLSEISIKTSNNNLPFNTIYKYSLCHWEWGVKWISFFL